MTIAIRTNGQRPPDVPLADIDLGSWDFWRLDDQKPYREAIDAKLREAAATAAKMGDFFQYAIDRPVSLQRQKSALLPIVGKDVEASRVSIYNERVQAKFPLLGLRLVNTTGMHLMQGPVTVFEPRCNTPWRNSEAQISTAPTGSRVPSDRWAWATVVPMKSSPPASDATV